MTTAARPTFEPARGGTGKGETDLSGMSKQYSSRDLPSHTKLKYRQEGQNTTGEVRSRDLRRELEDKEKNMREKRERNRDSAAPASSKKLRIEPSANLDADDPIDEDDEDDSDSDDDDDDAALMAELQRIKKERAQETLKKEAEDKAEEERIRTENILSGNPLLSEGGKDNFKVARRWDDDVVFKNCSRTEDDKTKSKNFINDSLRSDFHRRFMSKYIK